MADDKDLLERADALLHKYASQALRMETSAAMPALSDDGASIPVLTEAIEWIDASDPSIPTLTESLDTGAGFAASAELDLNAEFESTLAAIANSETEPLGPSAPEAAVAQDGNAVIESFDFSEQEWHAIEEHYGPLPEALGGPTGTHAAEEKIHEMSTAPPFPADTANAAAAAEASAESMDTRDFSDIASSDEPEATLTEPQPSEASVQDTTPSFEAYASRWNVDASFADDLPFEAPAAYADAAVFQNEPSAAIDVPPAADRAASSPESASDEPAAPLHDNGHGESLRQVTDTLTERALRELDQHLKEILEREIAPRLAATLDKSLSALLEQFSMHIEEMVSECVRSELAKHLNKDKP